MDTKRVFSCSSSTSDSRGEVLGGRMRLVSWGLRRSVIGALGGVGMRSGVPSLALGSSMNSVIDGNGRIVPGLSVSLCCSNTGAAATDGAWAGVGDATGDGWGAELAGEVTLTWKWKKIVRQRCLLFCLSKRTGRLNLAYYLHFGKLQPLTICWII